MPAPAFAQRPSFAIGDVHGRLDLLTALITAIDDIIAADSLPDPLRILLGDYIDRGTDGIAALKRVLTWGDVVLPGNHEQLMCVFLAGGPDAMQALNSWLYNGGAEVLEELGILDPGRMPQRTPQLLADKIREAIGSDLMEKLLRLPNHFRMGRYLFVHAGVHPRLGLAMLDQPWDCLPRSEDLDPLWVRGPFLTHDGAHEENVVVVHGHTPMNTPELSANRIGIDTGAYRSGRLTAVQLDGNRLRFIGAIGERG